MVQEAPVAELICDVGRTGRLLEFGLDPFTRGYEVLDACIQTEDRTRRTSAAGDHGASAQGAPSAAAAKFAASAAGKSPPAAQVLRLVVGLLGLEVHAKPKSGSEAWLTFQDATNRKLGLGLGNTPDVEGSDSPRSPSKAKSIWGAGPEHQATHQMDWQARVLSHLRKHLESGSAARGGRNGDDDIGLKVDLQGTRQVGAKVDVRKGSVRVGKEDTGIDFLEHLEIAEYVLMRIAHAVTVLQDPEKQDRPIVLREYTEKMVLDVCADLRQWLEQLATVLSLYHVHILDLENERCRLQGLLDTQQAKCAEEEQARKGAVLRHNCLKDMWEEEKMRRRAEALLGISLSGEDEKIYTQKDVDCMFKEWEIEHVQPLLEELKELRAQLEGGKGKKAARVPVVSGAMAPEAVATLVQALNTLGERLVDPDQTEAVDRLADTVSAGGADLHDVLRFIEQLPTASRCASPTNGGGGGAQRRAVAQCLSAVTAELDLLDGRLRATPELKGLGTLVSWAKDTLGAARGSLQAEGIERSPPEWVEAPSWDIGSLGRRASRSMGVSTQPTPAYVASPTSDGDVEGRLRRLREELEAKLRAALAEAEMWKKKWEEAMQKMADEAAKADQLLADLRKRLADMEGLMQQAGVGKQASDAIFRSGLSEFMQGRDVFERLYRDALHRMRRLAEAQARIFEETSQVFFKNIASLTDLEAHYETTNRRPSIPQVEETERPPSVAPTARAPAAPATGHRTLASAATAAPANDGMPLQVMRLGQDRAFEVRSNPMQQGRLHKGMRDGWSELNVLPPLECRGRPVGSSPLRSVSPMTAMAADGCERKDLGRLAVGPRSPSPAGDEPAPEPSARAEPAIGLWGGKVREAVGLQPRERQRRPGDSRPGTSGSGRPGRPQRGLRNPGTSSMPHLSSQPRLLVQSLGAAN